MTRSSSIAELSDKERTRANQRLQMLRPHLENGVPLARVVEKHSLILRTVQRWIQRYRKDGLIGLARKPRKDKWRCRVLSLSFEQEIIKLAENEPDLKVAEIHRNAEAIAMKNNWPKPTYSTIYNVLRRARDHEIRS